MPSLNKSKDSTRPLGNQSTPPNSLLSLTEDATRILGGQPTPTGATLSLTGETSGRRVLPYTEQDPIWTSEKSLYYTRLNLQTSGGSSVHWNNITNRPTTLAGYGIVNAQPLDADLTAIAALGFTSSGYLRKTALNTWSIDTNIWANMPLATSSTVGGIMLGAGASLFLREDGQWVMPAGGGGGDMVYPPAGIPLSTGSAWGTSITNNSTNWNTAYSWGNHAGLYEPVLGNPSVNGYVLSSTTTGVRSWIAPPTGGTTDHSLLSNLQGGTAGEYYHFTANLYNTFEYVPNGGTPYLRVKLPIACDYDVQAYSDFSQFPPTIWESMPLATTTTIGGIQYVAGGTRYLREDGTWQVVTTGGTSMIYPGGSGIPIVVGGASWGTTITDNSTNWNTAYGWGNHAGLYRPISYVPAHNDTTSIQGGSAGEYYHLIQEIFDSLIYVPNGGNPYLRVSLPIACDYDVQAYSDFSQFPPTIWESMPLATSTTIGGIQLGSGSTQFLREDGTWQTVTTGSSMVYPAAGIAVSTGSAWGTSVTNNSANWNTAYSWGNHAGLYEPLISKSTGYLRYTGSAWEFKNETYSLSSHTHTNMVDYSGTPVNDQVAVFTDANTIEGHTGFTYSTVTGYADIAGISRASGSLQHLTLQAGAASGAAGTDAGNLVLKAGNALNADSVSEAGSVYLVPGNKYSANLIGDIYLGDDSSNHNSFGFSPKGVAAGIGIRFTVKGTAPISLYGNQIDLGASTIFLGNSTYSVIQGSQGTVGNTTGYNVTLRGGSGYVSGNTNGGNLYLYGGFSYGTGTMGNIYFGSGAAGYLPAQTTETNLVYYNGTTGKLAYEDAYSVLSDWFVIEGTAPNQYIRCKYAFASDYDIQAYTDFGQFPATIWDDMPLATSTTVGGIQLGSGTSLFLREDGTWQAASGGSMTYPGAGIAISTGSAWATSITPSTGYLRYTGSAYEWKNETYSISTHTHAESTITFTDITTNNATTGQHGYLPKLGGGTTNFLRADGTWAAPGGGVTPVDSTLLDWSTDRYQPYAAAAAGAFDSSSTTPTGTTRMNYGGYFYATQLYEGATRVSVSGHTQAETTITFTDVTTGNATTGQHGYLPKLGGGTTNFLRADGTWAAAGGGSANRIVSWTIASPATGGIPGPRMAEAGTVTRIDAYVTAATSATFNIEERSTIGSAGTNIMTSDLAATTTGASQTSFADSALAAGNWLWVDISAVSGTPGILTITLTYTV